MLALCVSEIAPFDYIEQNNVSENFLLTILTIYLDQSVHTPQWGHKLDAFALVNKVLGE